MSLRHLVSNEELNSLKDNGHISDKQYDELVSMAYNSDHPLIYKKALKPIKPDEYSINLLWLHKEPVASGHFMGQDDQLLQDKVIKPIFNWVRKQPEAIINFWYDGAMISTDAIAKTLSIIKNQNNQGHINFRDIRDIDLVKQHERIYKKDVAVFLRVDLAKALIADHLVKNSKETFAVVTDNDVVAISKEHLFDDRTLSALELKGHIFGKCGGVYFENSFFILSNQGKELFDGKKYLDWHYEKIIIESIKTIESNLDKSLSISPELIFNTYKHYNSKIYNNLITNIAIDEKYKSDLVNTINLITNNKPLVFPQSQFNGFPTYDINLYDKFVDILTNK